MLFTACSRHFVQQPIAASPSPGWQRRTSAAASEWPLGADRPRVLRQPVCGAWLPRRVHQNRPLHAMDCSEHVLKGFITPQQYSSKAPCSCSGRQNWAKAWLWKGAQGILFPNNDQGKIMLLFSVSREEAIALWMYFFPCRRYVANVARGLCVPVCQPAWFWPSWCHRFFFYK